MFDWLIKDTHIIDGLGNPRFLGDIAIRGDIIAQVGNLGGIDARHVIEARGRITAPGFIDMHSHSDVLYFNGSLLPHKVYQGVTMELIGQDGISLAPLEEKSKRHAIHLIVPLSGVPDDELGPWDVAESLRRLEEKRPQINVMTLVGHCNLRLAVMGHKMGLPSSEELERMGKLLAASLKQGAAGLSLGLIYPPSSYSETNELIYLGKVVKERDSILVAHIRNEQEGLFRALEEMIAVGRESGCRIHISHLKCSGRENWGRMAKVLGVLENGLAQGVDISFDQYPYEASCTVLSVLLPGWALEGGWAKLRKRLSDIERRKAILVALEKSIEGRGGPAAIVIASVRSSKNQPLVGKTLEQIARERGIPFDEMALNVLIEEKLQAVAIYHSMSKDDVECAMMHFLHTVGSDGILSDFPHPRAYGTFPRIIAHFCRDRGLFSLEKAIQRMTSVPAKRLRLTGRGKIEAGAHADLVVFDPDKFRDNASYNDPQKNASGLDWLFVNGRAVLKEREIKDTRPGRIIVSKGQETNPPLLL